jgi:hypothetical protein
MGAESLVHRVLDEIGIRKERYDLEWASAAEAPRFVQLITEFTERMKELGPLGQAEGLGQEELKERLQKGLDFVSSQKTRISFGNASKAVRKDKDWSREHIDEVMNTKMAKTLAKAFG